MSRTHLPKKAPVFSQDDLNRFLIESPSTPDFVTQKLTVLFAINGALRCKEIAYIHWNDVELEDDGLFVSVPCSKTDQNKTGFRFFCPKSDDERLCALAIFDKYKSFFTEESIEGRLFRKFRNNKPTKQPLGYHYFEKVARSIATFLQIENSEKYTSHSFRRSAATIISNNGATVEQIKSFGRWKSTTVMEGYLENSDQNKKKLATLVSKKNELVVTKGNGGIHFSNITINNNNGP